jgi:hypothetical protein
MTSHDAGGTLTPSSAVTPFARLRERAYGCRVGSADEPRYLARGLGYVDSSARAMDKLECVDELEQSRQTLAAHRRWESEQRRAWGTARRRISIAVETFKRDGHPDPRLLSDVHVIQRQVERVDRRLGL